MALRPLEALMNIGLPIILTAKLLFPADTTQVAVNDISDKINGDKGAYGATYDAEKQDFTYINNLMNKGEFATAIHETNKFKMKHAESDLLDDILYLAAKCWLNGTESELTRLNEAERILTKMESYHRGSPFISQLQSNLAYAYFESGKLNFDDRTNKTAKRRFEKVLEHDPDNGDAYYMLGNIESRMKNNEEAIKFYETAIKLSPDHADAHACLGNSYYNDGQIGKAYDMYSKAISLKPQDNWKRWVTFLGNRL